MRITFSYIAPMLAAGAAAVAIASAPTALAATVSNAASVEGSCSGASCYSPRHYQTNPGIVTYSAQYPSQSVSQPRG
jgi:hypothetical protein